MTNEEIFETLSNVYMTPQEHRAWKELYAKVTKYENNKDAPYKEDMKYYEVEDWANDNGYIVVPLKMFDEMMNTYKAMPKRCIEKDIEILNEIIESGWLISDLEKCTAIDACEDAITALKQCPVLDKIREKIEEGMFVN